VNDSIFISFDDLKSLFRRLKGKMRKAALVAGLGLVGWGLIQQPQYVAEATFKQSSGKLEQNYDLKNFFRTLVSQDSESSTVSLMFSHNILRRCIEELGWQANVANFKSIHFLDNIRTELGFSLANPDLFGFKHVIYRGESHKSFLLRFESPETYEILNKDETLLCKGAIGESIELEDIKLTLDKTPKNLKINKIYQLSFFPSQAVTSVAKSKFSIKPSQLDRSVLCLKYKDRSPERAAAFLNQIMISYQNYLREENQILADAQLKYLEKRQEELNAKHDKTLQEHVAYLKQSVGDRGFIGLHQEIEMLSVPQETYTGKLFDIDFEISHLASDPESPPSFAQTYLQEKLDPIDFEHKKMASHESKTVSSQLDEALLLLGQLEKSETISSPRNPTFASLIARLKNAPDPASALEAKNRLVSNLRDFIHSLHLKQKVLEEETSYAQALESDFHGLDLESARKLHVQYHNSLDQLHAGLKQLLYLQKHVDDPECELGSLVNILPDAITQDMVQKASQLELQLQDALNRSEREHERFREALSLQKRFIGHHISHSIELQRIRAELTKEKIASLQQLILSLLTTEKKLIEDKLQDLKNQMADVPEKWRLEHLLKLKTDLTKGMMEGLTHLTESKILNRHLYNVESKPIDKAVIPAKPLTPHLFLFSCGGALLGALAVYLWGLFSGLARGFPTSLENLKLIGEHTSGTLSETCDAPFEEIQEDDLETLRHTASFLYSQKESRALKTALLGEKNPNFSHNLASILALRGGKSIILDCNFDQIVSSEDIPGLWHYLSGQTDALKIRKLADYDFVPSGGTTRHATELFTCEPFSKLLSKLEAEYDFIFISSRAKLSSSETLELLKNVNATVVSITDEPLDILLPYRQSSRQKEKQNVTFIQYEMTTN